MTEVNSLLARAAVVGLLCMAATACSSWRGAACHAPAPYRSAQTGAPLKIPPNLEAPDTTQALNIPELNVPEPPPRHKGDPCLDEPPPYNTPKPAPEPAA